MSGEFDFEQARPRGEELLADLTPVQIEAVTHGTGPLLILAGPGSGKTRVITRRVAWLLDQGVHAGNILAITFTNKAAGEMRQRVETLVPGSRVWISTFHAFGARLLRQYADRLDLDRNFTIYDQNDRDRLVKIALEDAGLDPGRFNPDAIQGAISKAKNQLLSPQRYAERAHDFFSQAVARVYPCYEKRLRDANALDFDDLLYWPALILKNNQELRQELDARFKFVLVDEYQDTNSAQYAIARYLSMDQPNLCVVGDADQSIYAWRGADIRNILDFERDFPGARVLTLSQNYRSTKAILSTAGQLIAHNVKRKPKDLFTDNPVGEPVRVLVFDSGKDEARGVARRIRAAVQQGGRNFRDFAVFLRINALSREVEKAFVEERVPFQIVRGLAFYDRKENRDILAYLRLLLNPRDDLSFLRVINEPSRGIGKVTLERLQSYAQVNELSLLDACFQAHKIPDLKGKAGTALKEFAALIKDLQLHLDASPESLIRQVIDDSGYRRALEESRDEEDMQRLANINELITAASQFARDDPTRTVADFLENVTLSSDVDGWDETQDRVSVMTLHAAKGLEFPVVYILACEDGILPHERSKNKEDQLEEERRLLFVGMTRAREELYLSHARGREFRGQHNYSLASGFLSELPSEHVERIDLSSGGMPSLAASQWRSGSSAADEGWEEAGIRPASSQPKTPPPSGAPYTVGMLVHHEVYGLGRILEVSGQGALRRVRVRFTRGDRTLLVDKVQLRIVRPG